MKRAARMITFVVGVAAAGCVTTPPPKQSHIEASSAIRAAEEFVRTEAPIPDAELYLSKARDHVRAGEKLLEAGRYEDARDQFERAEADAETSLTLARAHEAEDEAKRAEAQLEGVAIDVSPKVAPDKTEVEINVDAD